MKNLNIVSEHNLIIKDNDKRVVKLKAYKSIDNVPLLSIEENDLFAELLLYNKERIKCKKVVYEEDNTIMYVKEEDNNKNTKEMSIDTFKYIMDTLEKISDENFKSKYEFIKVHPLFWTDEEILLMMDAEEDINSYIDKCKEFIKTAKSQMEPILYNDLDKDIYNDITDETLDDNHYSSVDEILSIPKLTEIYTDINNKFNREYIDYLEDLYYYPFIKAIIITKNHTDKYASFIIRDLIDKEKNELREKAISMYNEISNK